MGPLGLQDGHAGTGGLHDCGFEGGERETPNTGSLSNATLAVATVAAAEMPFPVSACS